MIERTAVRALLGVKPMPEKRTMAYLKAIDERLSAARDSAKPSVSSHYNGQCRDWHAFVQKKLAEKVGEIEVRVIGRKSESCGTFYQIALKDGNKTRSFLVHESCISDLKQVGRGHELYQLAA